MTDEYGSFAPGSYAKEYASEEAATYAFNNAIQRGEVQTIQIEREYIVVE